jgi:hypothetical protein
MTVARDLPSGVHIFRLDTPLAFVALDRFVKSVLNQQPNTRLVYFYIIEASKCEIAELNVLISMIKRLSENQIESEIIVSKDYWQSILDKTGALDPDVPRHESEKEAIEKAHARYLVSV